MAVVRWAVEAGFVDFEKSHVPHDAMESFSRKNARGTPGRTGTSFWCANVKNHLPHPNKILNGQHNTQVPSCSPLWAWVVTHNIDHPAR
ncbi:hypothetical protein M404DRAFT_384767 [Pisolithus tinctorius Marx 270]|uniref:Uncharacterized protein n=1 Tax=Pisolithus tinctorius Marx 270 TaxID=870435 RepID=A0A0C3J9Q2_PISTI|nr:hypothetical protein M404DRAFT_384767 [Pisolithus tinctorius Marx 270]